MNKTIISLFAVVALVGCATTPAGTASKPAAAKPATNDAFPPPPEINGLKGRHTLNGLIVVVPRGIFSCDAAVRKMAKDYQLFQETREFNNDGNGFSYEYSDIHDTPYVIEIKGSNEKAQVLVRAGHAWENTQKRSVKLMQIILDELAQVKPVVGEEKSGDSSKHGI